MLRALRVSRLTICPLGQPEKAIGLEPQIEPWLPPDNRTACCVISQTTSSRQRDESGETEQSRILTSIHGLDVRRNFFAPSSRGRTFFLDIPLYRTRKPDKSGNGT